MNPLKYLSGLFQKKQQAVEEPVVLNTKLTEALFWQLRDGIAELLEGYQPAAGANGNAKAFLDARERYLRANGVSNTAYVAMVADKSAALLEERKKLIARERVGNLGTAQNIPVV